MTLSGADPTRVDGAIGSRMRTWTTVVALRRPRGSTACTRSSCAPTPSVVVNRRGHEGSQLLLGAPLVPLHERDQRLEVALCAEEELEQEAVAAGAADQVRRGDPCTERAPSGRGDPVDGLVGPGPLRHRRRRREPAGDE